MHAEIGRACKGEVVEAALEAHREACPDDERLVERRVAEARKEMSAGLERALHAYRKLSRAAVPLRPPRCRRSRHLAPPRGCPATWPCCAPMACR